jgi:hypothetical protein
MILFFDKIKKYRILIRKFRNKDKILKMSPQKNSRWIFFVKKKYLNMDSLYVETFLNKVYVIYKVPKKFYKVWYLNKFVLFFILNLAILFSLLLFIWFCIIYQGIFMLDYIGDWLFYTIDKIILDPHSSYNIYNDKACWIYYEYSHKLLALWRNSYGPKMHQVNFFGIMRREARHNWSSNTPYSYFTETNKLCYDDEFWIHNISRYVLNSKTIPLLGSLGLEEEGLGNAFSLGKDIVQKEEMAEFNKKYLALEHYDPFFLSFYNNINIPFERLYKRLYYRWSIVFANNLDSFFGYVDKKHKHEIVFNTAKRSYNKLYSYGNTYFKRQSEFYTKDFGTQNHIMPPSIMANVFLGNRSDDVKKIYAEQDDNINSMCYNPQEMIFDMLMYAEDAYAQREIHDMALLEIMSLYMPKINKRTKGLDIYFQLSSPNKDTQITNTVLSYFVYYMFRICFFFNLYYQFIYLLNLKFEYENDLQIIQILENNINNTATHISFNIPNLVDLFYIELKDYIEQETLLAAQNSNNEVIDPKGNRSYKRYLYFLFVCKREWLNNFENICSSSRVENWFFDVYLLPRLQIDGSYIKRALKMKNYIPRQSFLADNFMKIFVESYKASLVNSPISFANLLSYFDNRHYRNKQVKISNKYIFFQQIRDINGYLFTDKIKDAVFALLYIHMVPHSVSYDLIHCVTLRQVATFISTHGKAFLSKYDMLGTRFFYINLDENQRYDIIFNFTFNKGLSLEVKTPVDTWTQYGTTDNYLNYYLNMYESFDRCAKINIPDQKFFLLNEAVLERLTQKELLLQKIRWQTSEEFFKRFPTMYVFFYLNQLHKYLNLSLEDTTNLVAEVYFEKELRNVRKYLRQNITDTAQWRFFFSAKTIYFPQIYKIPLLDCLDHRQSQYNLSSSKQFLQNGFTSFTHNVSSRPSNWIKFGIGKIYSSHFQILKILDLSKDYFYSNYHRELSRLSTHFKQLPDLNLADFFGEDDADPIYARDDADDILGSFDSLQLILEKEKARLVELDKSILKLTEAKQILETELTSLMNNLEIVDFYKSFESKYAGVGFFIKWFPHYELPKRVPPVLIEKTYPKFFVMNTIDYIYIKLYVNIYYFNIHKYIQNIYLLLMHQYLPDFDYTYQLSKYNLMFLIDVEKYYQNFSFSFFILMYRYLMTEHYKIFTFFELIGLKVVGEEYIKNIYYKYTYNITFNNVKNIDNIHLIVENKKKIKKFLNSVQLTRRKNRLSYLKELYPFTLAHQFKKELKYRVCLRVPFLTNTFAASLFTTTSNEKVNDFKTLFKVFVCERQRFVRQIYYTNLINRINILKNDISLIETNLLVNELEKVKSLTNFKQKVKFTQLCLTTTIEKLFNAFQINLHNAQCEFDEDSGTLSDDKPWTHFYFDKINFLYGEHYHSSVNLLEFIFGLKRDGIPFPWSTEYGKIVEIEFRNRVFDSYINYRKNNPMLFYYHFRNILGAKENSRIYAEIWDKCGLKYFARRWLKLGRNTTRWHILFTRYLGIETLEHFMDPFDYKVYHRKIELDALTKDEHFTYRMPKFRKPIESFGPYFIRNNPYIRDCFLLNDIEKYNIQRKIGILGSIIDMDLGRSYSSSLVKSTLSNYLLSYYAQKELDKPQLSEQENELLFLRNMFKLQPDHYGYIDPNSFFYDSSLDKKLQINSKRLTDGRFTKEAIQRLDKILPQYAYKPIHIRYINENRKKQIIFLTHLKNDIDPFIKFLKQKALKFKGGNSFIDLPIFSDSFRNKCELFEKTYDSKVVTIPVWFDINKDFDPYHLFLYSTFYDILSSHNERNPKLLAALKEISIMQAKQRKAELCEYNTHYNMQTIYITRFTI